MKTTLFGCVLSTLMLASCSSEQNVTEPVRLSDIVNPKSVIRKSFLSFSNDRH